MIADDDELHAQAQAQLWNAGVPRGTPVLVVEGEPSSAEPTYFATTTTTEAWAYGPPRELVAVVRVAGRSAAFPLARVAVDTRRVTAQPSFLGF